MKRKIVLIGLPTSGKSKTASILANLLSAGWVDTDKLIEQRYGKTIPWIFQHLGEDGFRALEFQAVSQALRTSHRIVALGGGAPMHELTRDLLSDHTVYYLKADPDYLADRQEKKSGKKTRYGSVFKQRPVLAGDARQQLRNLYKQRHGIYEDTADFVVEALSSKEAARFIAQQETQAADTILVGDKNPYQVCFGDNLSDLLRSHISEQTHRVLILCAPPVEKRGEELADFLAKAGLISRVMKLPDGEAAKQLGVLRQVWDQAANMGVERKDLIVAMGGGASTDLGGFAAATWLRGVHLGQIPTTLLGMVDAAVGGKTAIDWSTGKNLVGAFYPPSFVAVDFSFLQTLPEDEIVSGLGEVIKCGFIGNPEILNLLRSAGKSLVDPANTQLRQVIRLTVQVKADVVGADLYESGLREHLNFGHTLAHAIELAENYDFSHGRAVAIGMVYAANLGKVLGITPPEIPERIRSDLKIVGLPVTYASTRFESLLGFMKADKKVRDSVLRFVLLEGVARPVVIPVTDESALQEAAKLTGIAL